MVAYQMPQLTQNFVDVFKLNVYPEENIKVPFIANIITNLHSLQLIKN